MTDTTTGLWPILEVWEGPKRIRRVKGKRVEARQFRYHRRTANGEITGTSQAYVRRFDAERNGLKAHPDVIRVVHLDVANGTVLREKVVAS